MLSKLHHVLPRLLAGAVAAILALGAITATAAPAQAHDGAHVLIFTKTTQFRHTDAIDKGTPLITA
ncbi:MAG TPA: hypothetical protein VGE78_08105, partial [Agromyces sp.]